MRSGSNLIAILVIAAVSLCAVIPFLHYGIASGHDFEFHFNSWLEVVEHWKAGILYPHWCGMAHYGYGEARFIFYPPFSWTLGGLLGLVLPWKFVPGAYIWIVLFLSGCSMFALARRFLPWSEAVFAAALYAVNPYHLVIVYWRSAFAELLAAAYLPLLLLLIFRSEEDGRRIVAPLSLLMAAGWLTNLPSAVMMNYSLALISVCLAVSRRRTPGRNAALPVAFAALSGLLGAALAGFYLLPAYFEQSWVNLTQVLGPGVRPEDNFLFTIINDADHNRFNFLVSIVAAWQIAVLAALFLSRGWRKQKTWWLLVAWSALAFILMIPITLPLWSHLPELRFVQLPWRWLLCLNVAFALAVTMALKKWWLRAVVAAACLGAVLLVWHRVQAPWWDNSGDIQEMVDNQHDGIGNEGTDEYVPAGVDPYDVDQKAPQARFEGSGKARIEIQKWQAESRIIQVSAGAPGNLLLKLFNFPSWRTTLNGWAIESATSDLGQLMIPIPAGESRIEIRYVRGWDQIAGWLVSIFGLAIWLLWWRMNNRPSANVTASA